MTKTINRLPAILLAVIIAAGLTLAGLGMLQPVYGTDAPGDNGVAKLIEKANPGAVQKKGATNNLDPEDLLDFGQYYVGTAIPEDQWKWIIPVGESLTKEALGPRVQLYGDDYVLPESIYEVKVEKYLGYNMETGEELYEPAEFPLTVEPADAVDKEGNSVGGTAQYRLIATPTAEAQKEYGYKGKSYGYVFLYDDHTLNNYGANVDFGSEGEKYFKYNEKDGQWQYEVNPGKTLTLEVSVGSGSEEKVLTNGTDYEAYYLNQDIDTIYPPDYDFTKFPTTAGRYQLYIFGIDPYYGWDSNTLIKVGKDNPMKVKAKTIKAKKAKTMTFKAGKAFKFTKKAKGKVTYAKVSGSKKIKVSKAGKITVKKGLKKGKTYNVKVKVKARGDDTYLSGEQTVTLKVKIK